MNTDFQKYLIEEIEEVGDIALKLLIPNYLLKERKRNIVSPVFENDSNYIINDEDFSALKRQVRDLLKSNNFCLYRYVKGNSSWEKSYLPVSKSEENEILDNKLMWDNKTDTPSFFISNDNWQKIKEFILETLNVVESNLVKESKEAIKNYLNHGEYEMAFEILFTEIINHNSTGKIDYNKALKIGQELNLRNESIYDPGFWVKFESFCYNGRV